VTHAKTWASIVQCTDSIVFPVKVILGPDLHLAYRVKFRARVRVSIRVRISVSLGSLDQH